MKDQDIDDIFKKKLHENGLSYPEMMGNKEELWRDILRRKRKKKQRAAYSMGIAAALAAIIVVYGTWQIGVIRDRQYSQTEQATVETDTGPDAVEEAMEYILLQCRRGNPSCKSSEFLELQSEMEESALQVQEIDRQIARFGNDPMLVKARIRAENQKSEIIRDIMLML